VNDKLTRLWATKNKDDEWWSSFVTSPIAIAANYLVVDIKWLTPNLITLFSFLVAIVSVLFIIGGGTMNFIIAAILIQLSHVLDCMDGQMARYRNKPSPSGGYYDKLTDQIQVLIWFGAAGYAAYVQSQDVLSMFLAFIGTAFYTLRGYSKYVGIYSQMTADKDYFEKISEEDCDLRRPEIAGLGFGLLPNLRWLFAEQPKVLLFNEGVLVFMLSMALVLDRLAPMLWVFAVTQICFGLGNGWRRGSQVGRGENIAHSK
jgi:phosphatidylglycerophosphate synthase